VRILRFVVLPLLCPDLPFGFGGRGEDVFGDKAVRQCPFQRAFSCWRWWYGDRGEIRRYDREIRRRSGEMRRDEERSGEIRRDEERWGEMRRDEERSGEMRRDEERWGEMRKEHKWQGWGAEAAIHRQLKPFEWSERSCFTAADAANNAHGRQKLKVDVDVLRSSLLI
jgi:hypothetical protein